MGRWSDSGSSERARHRLPVPLVRPRWWPRPGPRWRSGSASATRRIETWYLSVASGTMLRLVAHHPVDAPGRLSWPMGPPGPSPRLKVGDRVLGPQPPIRGPMRPARSWSPGARGGRHLEGAHHRRRRDRHHHPHPPLLGPGCRLDQGPGPGPRRPPARHRPRAAVRGCLTVLYRPRPSRAAAPSPTPAPLPLFLTIMPIWIFGLSFLVKKSH